MSAPSSGGKTPQRSIQEECANRGKDAVVGGCIDLLEGRDVDGELILALGGPPARWVVTGESSAPPYWLRVWALQGSSGQAQELTSAAAWDEVALSSVEAALHDDAWRVREMAVKVVARHTLVRKRTTVAHLAEEDPVARVRGAAAQALTRLTAREQ